MSDREEALWLTAPKAHFFELMTLIREFHPMAEVFDEPKEGVPGIRISEDEKEAIYYDADGKEELRFRVEDPFLNYPGENAKNWAKFAVERCLEKKLGKALPWGIMTGIRPSKVAYGYLEESGSVTETARILQEHFLLRPDKARLCANVAASEREILKGHHGTDASVYVGIPFCPTRCLYCSFISGDTRAYQRYAKDYIEALIQEIKSGKELLKGRRVNSFYMGGGTPTTLDPVSLKRVLEAADELVDFSSVSEVTVEAGRPDTITREKLHVLKEMGVGRISINPQTMQQKTLDLIGRCHSVKAIYDSFDMARAEGFDIINMDLIVGLPGEGMEEVADTLDKVKELKPENLTVHTLAVKRSSRLNEIGEGKRLLTGNPDEQARLIDQMIGLAKQTAEEMALLPYYMYRQKNMAGNFENVGYARKGTEGRYNVEIMEEKQSIVAFGAGGVSKVYYPDTDRIERVPNMKGPKEYVERLDQMIKRKKILILGKEG